MIVDHDAPGTDRSIETEEGDVILARETGAPDGLPVIFLHGSPGCRLLPPAFDDVARRRGVRLISYDRAGFGGSTPQPGRRVCDAAAATAAVADAFGVARFGVWGISGGGPHALACAALLPSRVCGAVAVASFAPFGAPGLDWFAGLGESSRVEFDLARNDRDRLRSFVEEAAATVLAPNAHGVLEAWGSLLSAPDRAAVRSEPADRRAMVLRTALEGGLVGWIEDDIAFVEPWGFDPADIAVPVAIHHGDEDRMVPPPHGEWLRAVIPAAQLTRFPGQGHFGPCGDPVAPLEWLIETARRP